MPIYEYRCLNCGKKFSVIVFPWDEDIPRCSCGSDKLEKLISRFGRLKSEEERLESTVESAMREVDYSNPESVKNWMKRTLKDYAEGEFGEEEIEEMVESMAKGEDEGGGEGEEGENGGGEEKISE